MKEPISTFTRDGVTREAYTPGEAVALRADGWRETSSSGRLADAVAATVDAQGRLNDAQADAQADDTSLDLTGDEPEATE